MSDKRYLLRTCTRNMKCCSNPDANQHVAFTWPSSGPVEAPDWDPMPRCGGGLHGLLDGQGSVEHLSTDDGAQWLVVECAAKDVVAIDHKKAKARRGSVIYCGEKAGAIELLQKLLPGQPVVYSTATAGDRGTATAGDAGTATAGVRGTATAGYEGTATAGDAGTATAGYRGTATAGVRGTATAGSAGTATAGYAGTATAGVRGTATAGVRGTATAGEKGVLSLRWWNGERYRIAIFYVGEDGIEPNTAYRVDVQGHPIKAVKP